jgi:hypothetical protein
VQASNIFDIARQMLNLTGPDRVAAWKQLGSSVGDVMNSLTDYLNRVGQAIKNVNTMFDNARLEMKLQKTKDPNAQAAILKAAADQNLYQIKHAAGLGLGPDQVQQLTSDTLGLLTRIYNLDPSQQAYDWWQKQVDTLQQASNDALTQIGDAAKSAVQNAARRAAAVQRLVPRPAGRSRSGAIGMTPVVRRLQGRDRRSRAMDSRSRERSDGRRWREPVAAVAVRAAAAVAAAAATTDRRQGQLDQRHGPGQRSRQVGVDDITAARPRARM